MNNRVKNGSGCPYCAGKKVSVTNSLQLTFPEVARELHPSKNGDLTGDMVTFGTHQKVWWKCPQGPDHEWEMTVNERTNSAQQQGCPFCSGKRLSVTNSLIRLHPHVAKEWHPQKNSNLNLEQITVGTHQKVWWKCPDGTDHEWRTAVRERAAGTGCPFCAGHLVSVTNSLARVNPEIAKEWHPSKNRELTPDDVTSGTHKKVWWQCLDNGHEWPAPVHGRTGRDGTRCPACSLASRSVQEITLAFEILLFIDFDVDDRKVEISGKFLEGDMVLRSLSLVLEFDGSYYHKGEELHARDVQKTTTLTDAGWTVLRVREDPLRPISLHDLLVPKISDMKPVVNATLLQIEQLFEVRLEGLSGYLAESNLKNETARDRYIKKLLKGQKLRSET